MAHQALAKEALNIASQLATVLAHPPGEQLAEGHPHPLRNGRQLHHRLPPRAALHHVPALAQGGRHVAIAERLLASPLAVFPIRLRYIVEHLAGAPKGLIALQKRP